MPIVQRTIKRELYCEVLGPAVEALLILESVHSDTYVNMLDLEVHVPGFDSFFFLTIGLTLQKNEK